MKKREMKMRKNLKRAAYFAVLGTLLLAGESQFNTTSENSAKKDKTEVAPPSPRVTDPLVKINYNVDTLDTAKGTLAACFGTKIIRYFVPGNNAYGLSLSIMAHENKHRENALKGLRQLKLSPEQYFKMCVHDEISASMCELLTLRYEYLAATDKKAFLEEKAKGKFKFYFQAVKDGKINPEAKDAKSRDEEWAFIATETRKWWMQVFEPIYTPKIKRMVENYINRMDPNTPLEEQNCEYKKVFEIAYNIGGVDFGKYLDKDIEFSDDEIDIFDKVGYVNVLQGKRKEYYSRISARVNKIKTEGYEMSPEILTHVFLAEGLKMALNGIDAEIIKDDPEVVTMCYEEIKYQLKNSKKTIFSYMNEQEKGAFVFAPIHQMSPELISELYSYKDIDLSKLIEDRDLSLFFNVYKFSNLSYQTGNEKELQEKLNAMRSSSRPEKAETQDAPSSSSEPPRRSEKQTISVPNFSEPILTDAAPEQTEEIYAMVRRFNNIPEALKGCDLQKQALYYKNRKSK